MLRLDLFRVEEMGELGEVPLMAALRCTVRMESGMCSNPFSHVYIQSLCLGASKRAPSIVNIDPVPTLLIQWSPKKVNRAKKLSSNGLQPTSDMAPEY